MSKQDRNSLQRLTKGYEDMLEAAHGFLVRAEEQGSETLREALAHASEHLVELGRLSREEARDVADWVERDLHGAGEHLREEGGELRDWLRFDLELMEGKLMDMFAAAADRTALQLQALAWEARAAGVWKAGEVAGPGSLVCKTCGKEAHFHKVSHIPPCGACRGTVYHRPHAK